MVVMEAVIVLMVVMEAVIVLMVFMVLMAVIAVLVVMVLGKGGTMVVGVSTLLGSIMAALGTDITLGKGIV